MDANAWRYMLSAAKNFLLWSRLLDFANIVYIWRVYGKAASFCCVNDVYTSNAIK